ncbi:hypothetical protein ATANTOWER_025720, partial [Ataeniobius toweri]|nr:hypothetical protein [Ataeniobius toweri]
LSMILMVIIRYISAVLVWILTSLVVLGSLAGTSVLWWLYIDYRLYGNDTSSKVLKDLKEEVKEELRDSGQALLVYAASATIFTVRVAVEATLLQICESISECFCLCADHPSAVDALHEETSGAHHRAVPRSRKSLHPPPSAHPAALRHLPCPTPLLDLLDLGAALPGNHRLVLAETHTLNKNKSMHNKLPPYSQILPDLSQFRIE